MLGQLHDIRAARASNPKQGKISSRLLPPPTVGPLVGGLVAAPPPLAADGSLHVYLDCSPLGSAELQKLQQAGVWIERIEMAHGRVQARVDASALETLAGFSWVHAIRTVDRAVVRAGSVTTEGDAASRADVLRAQGLDGSGVVVGVISDGIDSLQAAQATNDLPDVVVPNDSRCQKGAGDEGTALLEIVHDVAPGAKLLFSGPASSLDMIDAVAVPDRRRRERDRRRLGVLRRAVLRGWPRGRSRRRRGDGRRFVSLLRRQRSRRSTSRRTSFLPRGRTGKSTTSRPAEATPSTGSSCRRAGRSPASCSGTIRSAAPPTTTTSSFSTPT